MYDHVNRNFYLRFRNKLILGKGEPIGLIGAFLHQGSLL